MAIIDMICLLILVSSLMLKVSADTTVFCEQPLTVDRVISFCGGTVTGHVFPNSLGYAFLSDGASIVTSYWDNNYASVHVTTQTLSTLAHQAGGFAGTCEGAVVNFCRSTKQLFTGRITHFTVFVPSGVTGDATFGTVTETVTSTVSAALDVTAVTDTVRETVTVMIDNKTCLEADTVFETVSYSIGTEGQLTIYTSGPTPGTSTVTLCRQS